MSFENPGFFEEIRMEWLWNRMGYFRYKKYVYGLQLKANENVLDFGCGAGAVSKYIAETVTNGKVVCIDTSDYWLTKAKKKLNEFSNVEYICEKIEDSALPDNYFDSVIIHFVLHDIDEDKRQDAINSLADKLNKKGQIHIREPTRRDHGLYPEKIDECMTSAGFCKIYSSYGNYFLWPHYTATFQK